MKKAQFTKQFSASFTAETYDRIKELTDQQGISMGEWVRIAVEGKLATINQNNISEGEQ